MRITIEPDIDGEKFEPKTWEQVVAASVLGVMQGQFLPEPFSQTYIGTVEGLDAMLGRLEIAKAVVLPYAAGTKGLPVKQAKDQK